MISYEENRKTRKFKNLIYNAITGEQSNPERRYCKCGHSMNFYSDHSSRCTYCGRIVYPSKGSEFREKIEKERRKQNVNNN